MALFTESPKLKVAAEIINGLNDDRLSRLLERLIKELHNTERAFTKEEEAKLQSTFQLSPDHLQLVLETSEFIFQQAVYHLAKPAVLQSQLVSVIGLVEPKAAVFVETWMQNGRNVVDEFKQSVVSKKQLTDIKWQTNIALGQQMHAKSKEAGAVLELTLHNTHKTTADTERLKLEFNHAQLYDFYTKLETVQTQLDALT